MSRVAAELLVLRQEGEHLDSSWCVGSARNDVRVLAGLPPLCGVALLDSRAA